MNGYFLGVDGGQSSTVALLGDSGGQVIGMGRSGPCNHVSSGDGKVKFRRVLRESIEGACGAGGINMIGLRFTGACLGFSGGPEDKDALVREMIEAENLIITNDARIALAGALVGKPGIITIAGTGSIAYGTDARGQSARAGGWGYVFGDEGSAFDITRQALRAALRLEEGWGALTSLHSALLSATDSPTANDLMHRFYTSQFSRATIARLAPLVEKAALAGDKVAQNILLEAAQQLSIITNAVAFRLFQNDPVRVAYLGGVFQSTVLLERFRIMLEAEGSEVSAPYYGPAAGALIEAYRAAGLKAVSLSGVPKEKT